MAVYMLPHTGVRTNILGIAIAGHFPERVVSPFDARVHARPQVLYIEKGASTCQSHVNYFAPLTAAVHVCGSSKFDSRDGAGFGTGEIMGDTRKKSLTSILETVVSFAHMPLFAKSLAHGWAIGL